MTKPKYLRPEEVGGEWREYFDFERQEIRQRSGSGKCCIWATCPDCGKARWVEVASIRHGTRHTPRCHPCMCAARHGKNHPRWAGGQRAAEGYVLLHYASLPAQEYEKFKSMFDHLGYIREHRLVLARHLGRSLRRGELIHHINEARNDNRLSNLRLLAAHHRGYDDNYYQKWQEALSENERLKEQLSASQGGLACQA